MEKLKATGKFQRRRTLRLIARTHDQTIREMRRLGGQLKHHFESVERTKSMDGLADQGATLRAIRRAIELNEKS